MPLFTNMTDPAGKVFPFLKLPLEIQRLIFGKCFEEPWKVYGAYAHEQRNDSHRSECASRSLLFVNKHFFEEAKLAIGMSRSCSFRGYKATSGKSNPFLQPAMIFDPAVTLIELSILEIHFLAPLKQRYVNLERVDVWGDTSHLLHRYTTPGASNSLLHILQGSYDTDMAKQIEKSLHDWEELMRCDITTEALKPKSKHWTHGVIVSVDIKFDAIAVQIPQKRYMNGQRLHIRFEVSERGCRVAKKWFQNVNHNLPGVSAQTVLSWLQAYRESDWIW